MSKQHKTYSLVFYEYKYTQKKYAKKIRVQIKYELFSTSTFVLILIRAIYLNIVMKEQT